MTVLVGRERTTGMTMAAVLPDKGSTGKFAVDKVLEFIAECGNQSGDIIVKSDQEAAIGYLVKDLVLERGEEKGCRTIVEEAPVGSKGSNSIVESGREIDAEANVVTFIAEYASYLVNRLEVG